MDLYAYTQIEDFEDLAKENGIEVPRLRGYRLMTEEKFVPQEVIDNEKKDCELEALNDLIGYFRSRKYVETAYDAWGSYGTIRWDKIHGKRRKKLKFEIKKQKRRIQQQYDAFNKYVGQNVLYIHARIGGENWLYYKGHELEKQPWFLETVDDSFDGTYCDIYAKLK